MITLHPKNPPFLVNADERIFMCYSMWLNENPFWSRPQHDHQTIASLNPEQLPEKEDSTILRCF
jgi:hypothetical protein